MDPNQDILGPVTPDMLTCNWAGKTQRFQSEITPRDTNADKNNIIVNYKIYDSNNTQIASLNGRTNSNGVSTIDYSFPAKGQYKIRAYVGDEYSEFPVTIETLVDTVTLTSDINNIVKSEIVQLTAYVWDSLGGTSGGIPVTFSITENIDNFTEETSIYDFNELEYDIHLPNCNLECKLKGQLGVSILPVNSNTESQILQISSDTYKTFKIQGLNYYLDGNLKGTLQSAIKKLYIWGAGGNVKELSFTAKESVTDTTHNGTGKVTIPYTYHGGTLDVEAIVDCNMGSGISNKITLTELSFDGITLTSDKDIISYNGGDNPDSATLTAQLTKNGANANVSGETVTFKVRKQSDDSLVETLTGTTDSSGKATVYYSAKHTNYLYIQSFSGSTKSNEIQIEDLYFYDTDFNSWIKSLFFYSEFTIPDNHEIIVKFKNTPNAQIGCSNLQDKWIYAQNIGYNNSTDLSTRGNNVDDGRVDMRSINLTCNTGSEYKIKYEDYIVYIYQNNTLIFSVKTFDPLNIDKHIRIVKNADNIEYLKVKKL